MSDPITPNSQPTPTTVSLVDLAPDQAFSIGAAVGGLLAQGMPKDRVLPMTAALAEFVRRGIAAQQAVDELLADERRRSRRRRTRQS
jgi:hypothetical protein